jgi:archaellum biogenesis protein FlaJ (TadC family)
MNSPSLDAPLASAPSSALLTLPHQETTSVPSPRTKRQKVTQFFLGLALGLGGAPIFAGFVNALVMALFPASSPLFSVLFGGLPLLAGILLTFRREHRLLGVGILAAILLLALVGFLLIVLFSLAFSQYCAHHEPAACG